MDFGAATGIPEGVRVIRLGAADQNEFYWQDGAAHQGPRPGANIVVAVNPGWVFLYDVHTDSHHPAQVFDPPRVIRWKIEAHNSSELNDIIGLEQRLKELGGLTVENEVQEQSPADSGKAVESADQPAVGGPPNPGSGHPDHQAGAD